MQCIPVDNNLVSGIERSDNNTNPRSEKALMLFLVRLDSVWLVRRWNGGAFVLRRIMNL